MTPELLQAAMGKFLEWNQRMEMAKAALREQCGVVPCNDGAHGGGPLFVGIEAYYDVYRGMKNLAKDMRRRPEKLKAACDAFFTAFVQPSVDNIQHVEDPQGAFYASMYTLCANLLSKKQIEEFLVPQAKIITEKIVETDIEFHDTMYHAARNNRLVGIISNLRDQLTRFRTLSMSYPGRLEATLEEHRLIVEAIAQGDRKAASRASERHMENSEKTLLQAMDAMKKKNESKAKSKKKKAEA
jgi:hypothetical protein